MNLIMFLSQLSLSTDNYNNVNHTDNYNNVNHTDNYNNINQLHNTMILVTSIVVLFGLKFVYSQ